MGSIHVIHQDSTRGSSLHSECSHPITDTFAGEPQQHESRSDVLLHPLTDSLYQAIMSFYQAVMDSLLLVSVFQLATRIRQYVEKTACKIR